MSTVKKIGEVDFIITKDFKAPFVVATGKPHAPSRVDYKLFRKGQMVRGKIMKENGIVLVGGTIPLPFEVLKQVIAKDISISNADGINAQAEKPKVVVVNNTTYVDAGIAGALGGLLITYLIEKKGWLTADTLSPMQNKLIGAGIGAALGMYVIYRKKKNKESEEKKQS